MIVTKTEAVTDPSSSTYGPIGWNRLGADIDGEAATDYSSSGGGSAVSLSSDGTIVAIGAYRNDGTTGTTNDDRGHVRVYQYDVTKTEAVTDQSSSTYGPIGWNRLGADIDGEVAGDWAGYSVSLSSDGLTVAVGSRYSDVNGSDAGQVRVYQYNDNAWTKSWIDIDGEAAGDESGRAVSLSSDGTIVAIGAWKNDGNG